VPVTALKESPMTLEDHARAIEAAIQAAADDGFHLDTGMGDAADTLELNRVDLSAEPEILDWVRLALPPNPLA
jgi:hypothetical protein